MPSLLRYIRPSNSWSDYELFAQYTKHDLNRHHRRLANELPEIRNFLQKHLKSCHSRSAVNSSKSFTGSGRVTPDPSRSRTAAPPHRETTTRHAVDNPTASRDRRCCSPRIVRNPARWVRTWWQRGRHESGLSMFQASRTGITNDSRPGLDPEPGGRLANECEKFPRVRIAILLGNARTTGNLQGQKVGVRTLLCQAETGCTIQYRELELGVVGPRMVRCKGAGAGLQGYCHPLYLMRTASAAGQPRDICLL